VTICVAFSMVSLASVRASRLRRLHGYKPTSIWRARRIVIERLDNPREKSDDATVGGDSCDCDR
jgi:hypothetical protein